MRTTRELKQELAKIEVSFDRKKIYYYKDVKYDCKKNHILRLDNKRFIQGLDENFCEVNPHKIENTLRNICERLSKCPACKRNITGEFLLEEWNDAR